MIRLLAAKKEQVVTASGLAVESSTAPLSTNASRPSCPLLNVPVSAPVIDQSVVVSEPVRLASPPPVKLMTSEALPKTEETMICRVDRLRAVHRQAIALRRTHNGHRAGMIEVLPSR